MTDPGVTLLLLHASGAICDNGVLASHYIHPTALKNLPTCPAAPCGSAGSPAELGSKVRPLKFLDALHKPSPAVGWAHRGKKPPTSVTGGCDGTHITEPPHRRAPWVSPSSPPSSGRTKTCSIKGFPRVFPQPALQRAQRTNRLNLAAGRGKQRDGAERRGDRAKCHILPYLGTVAISCTAPIDTA